MQEKMLRKEQQSALRTGKHTDGSRLELSQEDAQHRHQLEGAKEEERAAVKGLRRREEETRAKFEEHEREQKAEDKEHESHLAHELAEDRLAEKIALRRKEMTNEIERVEAHMQVKVRRACRNDIEGERDSARVESGRGVEGGPLVLSLLMMNGGFRLARHEGCIC